MAAVAPGPGNEVNANTIVGNAGAALSVSASGAAANIDVTSSTVSINATPVITYSGVASLAIGPSANLTFTLTPQSDVATLQDDAVAANYQSQLLSVNGTFTSTTFVNPMSSLLVNAGSGDDTITILPLDALANIPDITIEGVDGDDRFFESLGNGSVHLKGGADNDTYSLFGSTVVVTDDGGSDVYGITGSDATAAITINDQGAPTRTPRAAPAASPSKILARVTMFTISKGARSTSKTRMVKTFIGSTRIWAAS